MNILASFETGQEGNELLDAYLHGIDPNKINNVLSASGDLTAVDSWDSINDWKTFVSCDGPLCGSFSDVSESNVSDIVLDVSVPEVTTQVVTTTKIVPTANLYTAEECNEAQELLAASTDALEKIVLTVSCETACAEFDAETCD